VKHLQYFEKPQKLRKISNYPDVLVVLRHAFATSLCDYGTAGSFHYFTDTNKKALWDEGSADLDISVLLFMTMHGW